MAAWGKFALILDAGAILIETQAPILAPRRTHQTMGVRPTMTGETPGANG